jgi:hypothetical protein
MHRRIALLSAILLVLGGLGLSLAAPANSGGGFVVNVTKSVEAEGPQLGPYSVNITCTNEFVTPAGPFDFVINDTETVSQSVNFGDTCTVTETDDLGADSVSYSCAVDFQATCDNDQTVTIDQSDNGGAATVTILNTFDAEDEPDVVVEEEPEAEVVTATPTFTG